GLTALVVLVAAVFFYVKNLNADNEKAATELGKVYTYYDNAQYQIVIDGVRERNILGLKAIVEEYGSTHSGNLAKLYLADSYYNLDKFSEALKEYDEFSPEGQLLTVSRYAGIGACQEALKNYNEAAENFEKAATKYPNDLNAAENLNNAARNFAAAGQKEQALDLYKKLKKDHSTTPFGREADRYIAQLSV
ncbi:MAG: Tetratricopeptide domain protein, partial [Bacteroidetes bacterium]|nr:Tetratricopeptide domain protein [Bacteroidota bacterium]